MRTRCSFRARLALCATAVSGAIMVVSCSEATAPLIPKGYLVTATKGGSPVTLAAVGDTILVKAQLVDANNRPLAKNNQLLSWYFTSGSDARFLSPESETDGQGTATNYFVFGSKAYVSERIGVIDENSLSGNSSVITVTAGAPSQYIVKVGTLTPTVGTTVNVRAQLADRFGNPAKIAGRIVTWSLGGNSGGGGGYSYDKVTRTNRFAPPKVVHANRFVAQGRARATSSTGTFASVTSTTDDQGGATVDFTVGTDVGATYSIAAQDDQKASGQSDVIRVQPGPIAKFVVTPSVSDPPAGALVTLSASPIDAYGNVVVVLGAPLTWSVTGGGGTLASNVTSTNQAGVAMNQITTVSTPGTSFTVTVTGSSQAAGTSATITTQQQLALASMAGGLGASTSCGIATDGAVWCWGEEDNGLVASRPVPGKPVGDQPMSALTTSGAHTCGIAGGTVMCWGADDAGQLGDNSRTSRAAAAPINSQLSFTAITAGAAHTCALATSRDIYCWGASTTGRLGDGTGFTGLGPIKVAGGLSFTAVSAGGAHTCAIATTGAAYCWGANEHGQLGNGSYLDQPTPSLVAGGLTFTAISAGDSHTCGLSSGGIYCWGDNTFGQIGNGGLGTNVNAPTGVKVSGTFATLAAGGFNSCAISSTAAAYCWGDNTSGELGDPSFASSSAAVPIAVSGGLAFKSIAVGGSSTNDYYYGSTVTGHSCGITTEGVTYCWGANDAGDLGIGTFDAPHSTPTKVSGQH